MITNTHRRQPSFLVVFLVGAFLLSSSLLAYPAYADDSGTLIISAVATGNRPHGIFAHELPYWFSGARAQGRAMFWDGIIEHYDVPSGEYDVFAPEPEGWSVEYGADCDASGMVEVFSGNEASCLVTFRSIADDSEPEPLHITLRSQGVGGFNDGDALQTPEVKKQEVVTPPRDMNLHITGTQQDSAVAVVADEMSDTSMNPSPTVSDSHDDAITAVGSLSGIVPCSAGHVGWLIVNIVLLVLILMVWKDRRDSHWLATILLVIVALGMNSWAVTCGLGLAWLPALLSVVSWLLMKLLGRS